MQFMPSAVGTIVHYFAIAPMLAKFRPIDPFSPEALRQRRAAVLDFAAAALFANRDVGIRLAEQVASREEPNPTNSTTTAVPKRQKKARRKAL
jgi:hypothetical protein